VKFLHLWYICYQENLSRVIYRTLSKAVGAYELRELSANSALYNTVMAEGVQIA